MCLYVCACISASDSVSICASTYICVCSLYNIYVRLNESVYFPPKPPRKQTKSRFFRTSARDASMSALVLSSFQKITRKWLLELQSQLPVRYGFQQGKGPSGREKRSVRETRSFRAPSPLLRLVPVAPDRPLSPEGASKV